MKIQVSLTLDVPDDFADDGLPKRGISNPSGESWGLSFLRQAVFDNLTNYAQCSHLSAAMDYMITEATAADKGRKRTAQKIVEHHREWASILEKAQRTLGVVVLPEERTEEQEEALRAELRGDDKKLSGPLLGRRSAVYDEMRSKGFTHTQCVADARRIRRLVKTAS